MFIHYHEVTMETADGSVITVRLRLTAGALLKLKQKYKESALETITQAVNDIERFADIMSAALKWKDSDNPNISGTELIDLMADNGMLGIAAKQKLLTTLASQTETLSADEKDRMDARMEAEMAEAFGEKKAAM